MGRTVRLHVGTVDGGALGDCAGRCERFDQIGPELFSRPAVEAVVDRGRWAAIGRTIAPPATNLENMDDAGDHPAVIDAASAPLFNSVLKTPEPVIRAAAVCHLSEVISGLAVLP